MFLPYADEPNPYRYTPWVTYGLLAVNVAVYLLVTIPASDLPINWANAQDYRDFMVSHNAWPRGNAYDLMVFEYGFRMAAFQVSDLLTSMFLHGGFMHLAGNMLFLWIYGDNIEHRLGRFRFLVAYLVGGMASCVIYGLMASDPTIPLVGASGAISTVLGGYWVLFPDNRIKCFVVFAPFYVGRLEIKARWVLLFYVLVENLLPQLQGTEDGVAYGAHLGGFVAGVLVAFLAPKVSKIHKWHLP